MKRPRSCARPVTFCRPRSSAGGRVPMLRKDWFVNVGGVWQTLHGEFRKKFHP